MSSRCKEERRTNVHVRAGMDFVLLKPVADTPGRRVCTFAGIMELGQRVKFYEASRKRSRSSFETVAMFLLIPSPSIKTFLLAAAYGRCSFAPRLHSSGRGLANEDSPQHSLGPLLRRNVSDTIVAGTRSTSRESLVLSYRIRAAHPKKRANGLSEQLAFGTFSDST